MPLAMGILLASAPSATSEREQQLGVLCEGAIPRRAAVVMCLVNIFGASVGVRLLGPGHSRMGGLPVIYRAANVI